MADTYQQVKWSTNNDVTVTSGSTQASDAITTTADAATQLLQVKADNQGTPAQGDVIEVYVEETLGDPDADPDSADEYTSASHRRYLGMLDTNADDPSVSMVWEIPAGKGFKVVAESLAASNSIKVSSTVLAKVP